MKISGDAGHNCYPDGGASAIRKEDELTREVWNLVQAKLKDTGYTVVDCTPWNSRFNSVNGSLAYRVKLANESGSELHLCIHFNAGGGTGVECWVIPGGTAEQYGRKICEEISAVIDIPNRGVKDGRKLYIPAYTNMSCVLIECSFVDSQNDMGKYDADKIATAIVRAITGETITTTEKVTLEEKPIIQTPTQNTKIEANAEVVSDWFYIRDVSGNIIPGRVDIGDRIEVLDISYSKQLALVKYPTPNGTRTEYIKNVPSLIKYLYAYQYENGSTIETVYQDSTCTQIIGSLDPYEKATPLFRRNGILHVAYDTALGKHTKSGYVKYNGKFNMF